MARPRGPRGPPV